MAQTGKTTSDTPEDKYIRLRGELRIDRDMLDEELITHAHNYHHVGEQRSYAVARRDRAKFDLDVEEAKLDKDIRDAAAADEEKITEPGVKAQIKREPSYHRAYRHWLDACEEADKWEALERAYRHRIDALKGLVSLHNTGYWGEITGSGERRDARERFDDRRRAR